MLFCNRIFESSPFVNFLTHFPFRCALGWPGISGGVGERHGVMAVHVFGTKTRTVSSEQWPAHHTQSTLLPLFGDTVCTPTRSQNVGEMWSISVVREKKQNALKIIDSFLFNCSLSFYSLLSLCSLKNQDGVLKLVVATLDYSRDGLARVILSKILTAATDVRHNHLLLE